MAKILFINPNKWGRGITHIWIASHSGILQQSGHKVELFDCTFFKNWSVNEVEIQTQNKNYKKTDYLSEIKFKNQNIFEELKKKIDNFKPDFIFWSAISSHIHAEGEYVNIQNGYDLLENINTENIIKITSGLQATSATKIVLDKMPNIDYLIMGESELILDQILNLYDNKEPFNHIPGLAYKKNNQVFINKKQEIMSDLNKLVPYNYDLFDDQVFLRAYNGKIVRAVDYEMSRGCIYSCNYCVETIIQSYYGFKDSSKKTGAINNFKKYLRNKSSLNIYKELKYLNKIKKIELIRCQDTNFLTNDRSVLEELADLLEKEPLNIKLYIETRPEGINEKSIKLLKRLNVDGVGMGVELADEDFRENTLNRFASQQKTIDAFINLKQNGIKRTAYNIIGLPLQKEQSILSTIEFNKLLQPDNVTVAYYSPYYGTKSQVLGKEIGIFNDYEDNVDSALRSKAKNTDLLTLKKLDYYKKNFVKLVKNEL